MKKGLALLTVLTLVIGAVALPALAEETGSTVDQVTSATTQAGHGSRNNRQQAPGQNSQDNQQAQPDGRGGRNMKQSKTCGVRNGSLVDPSRLLKAGVITQEVYDAIMAYVKEQSSKQADVTAPAGGTESPALPENSGDESAVTAEQILESLLNSGAITREQYDLLLPKTVPAGAASET